MNMLCVLISQNRHQTTHLEHLIGASVPACCSFERFVNFFLPHDLNTIRFGSYGNAGQNNEQSISFLCGCADHSNRSGSVVDDTGKKGRTYWKSAEICHKRSTSPMDVSRRLAEPDAAVRGLVEQQFDCLEEGRHAGCVSP